MEEHEKEGKAFPVPLMKCPFAFSNTNEIAFSNTLTTNVLRSPISRGVLNLIKKRAELGLGFDTERNLKINLNLNQVVDIEVWKLVDRIEKWNVPRYSYELWDFGILQILSWKKENWMHLPIASPEKWEPAFFSREEAKGTQKRGGGSVDLGLTTLDSEIRSRCLLLCGWVEEFRNIRLFLEGKLSEGAEFTVDERTIALCIVNQKFSLAQQLVQRKKGERDPKKRMLFQGLGFAMADLSAFVKSLALQPKSIGQVKSKKKSVVAVVDTLKMLKTNYPYLQWCFKFVTRGLPSVKEMLSAKKIRVCDKVAFACRYVPNEAEILDFVKKHIQRGIKFGNPRTLLLTGLGELGVKVIDKFVEMYGDVQLASLVFKRHVRLKSREIECFYEEYKQLLNRWRLWNERVVLERNYKKKYLANVIPRKPPIVVHCSKCRAVLGSPNSRFPSATQLRQISASGLLSQSGMWGLRLCLQCGRAKLKCSVCLMPFGMSPKSLGVGIRSSVRSERGADFMFSWCKNCHHGGHVIHLKQWFSKHEECPFFNCHCVCCFQF